MFFDNEENFIDSLGQPLWQAAASNSGKCVDCHLAYANLSMEDGQVVKICTRKIEERYKNELLLAKSEYLKQLHECKISLEQEKRSSELFYEKQLFDCHNELQRLNESIDMKIEQLKQLDEERREFLCAKEKLVEQVEKRDQEIHKFELKVIALEKELLQKSQGIEDTDGNRHPVLVIDIDE